MKLPCPSVQTVQDYLHGADDVRVNELTDDDQHREHDGLMRVGWDHFRAIQDTHRVIDREAVAEDGAMVVEGPQIHNQIRHWIPHPILLCVVEPGASLPVNVDDEVEDEL